MTNNQIEKLKERREEWEGDDKVICEFSADPRFTELFTITKRDEKFAEETYCLSFYWWVEQQDHFVVSVDATGPLEYVVSRLSQRLKPITKKCDTSS